MPFLLSQDFTEKVLLLLLTAAITGLLVPLVKWNMDQSRFKEQKTFEADMARQTKIIEAQNQLLADLSQIFWELLFLAQQVTFYRTHNVGDRYQAAHRAYDEKNWDLFVRMNREISKSQRLVSAKMHDRLTSFYDAWFIDIDPGLGKLLRRDPEGYVDEKEVQEAWQNYHAYLVDVAPKKTEEVLSALAEDLRLSVQANTAPTKNPRWQFWS